MTRIRSSTRLAATALLLLFSALRLSGQVSEVNQEKLEAAMTLQLLSFAEWPYQKGAPTIDIGILESPTLYVEMKKLLQNERYIGKYTVHLLHYRDHKNTFEQMDALFFDHIEPTNIPRLIKRLEGEPIVFLGSFDGFLELGGMVNFVVRQKRFGFEIHTKNAKSHNIEFRAKLLRMATNIIEE